MSPRVTNAYIAARRDEILAAAFRCFARSGLHGATMQEIAEEAGLSAGALYGYFDGKEALVRALAAESAERRKNSFTRLGERCGVAVLAELVIDLMADLDADEALSTVRLDVRLWAEMLDRPDGRTIVVEAFGELIEPVAHFVRREAEEHRMRSDVDPKAVGRIVVSLLAGLELQRAYEPGLDLDTYREAVGVLIAGLEA